MNEVDLGDIHNAIVTALEILRSEAERKEPVDRAATVLKMARNEVAQMMTLGLLPPDRERLSMDTPTLIEVRDLINVAIDTLAPEGDCDLVGQVLSLLRATDREIGQMLALELIQ